MNHEEVKQQLLTNTETLHAYEHPPLQLEVARAVVECRRSLEMSQEELAERLGTSQNQVWRIESGDANITIKTLEKLREVLGLHLSIESPDSGPNALHPLRQRPAAHLR